MLSVTSIVLCLEAVPERVLILFEGSNLMESLEAFGGPRLWLTEYELGESHSITLLSTSLFPKGLSSGHRQCMFSAPYRGKAGCVIVLATQGERKRGTVVLTVGKSI